MKRSSAHGDTTKRYAGKTERGPSAWKREWNSFMTNVDMADEGAVVRVKGDLGESDRATFSYLFKGGAAKAEKTSAAKKQAKRAAAEEEESRMRRLVERAAQRGVALEGMNRKARRAAVLADQTDAELKKLDAPPPRPKPHELMDPKLAWYQQGPSPLDVVSEKLVAKKAMKHARQNGWRYNFELPHPSWVAARARKRIEGNLLHMGWRTVLNGGDSDSDG